MTDMKPKIDAKVRTRKRKLCMTDLIPDARNANKGTVRGSETIKHSLEAYGAGRSVLIDRNGRILAGNKTAEAAAALGFNKLVVVPTDGKTLVAVQRTDLDLVDPKTRKAAQELAIADNRASELNLSWDPEVLAEISKDSDLSAFFTEAETAALLGEAANANDLDGPAPRMDQAIELQKKWKTSRGQLWQIGKHRLMCGYSTRHQEISCLMGTGEAAKASMCFTDPPWNVAIGVDNNPRHRQRQQLQNDSLPQEDFSAFLGAAAKTISQFTSGDVYCVMGCEQWPAIDSALRASGLHWSASIIWVKDLFVLGRSKYHRRYEPIWYGWPSVAKSSFIGGRDLDDVWEIDRPRTSEEHPTMKPVELYRRAICNSSAHGAAVFDPFAGSGTILVSAEQSGRVARGCEIDPKYVAVALERMSEMGLKPKLIET